MADLQELVILDALNILSAAQQHQQQFPELQSFWHELRLNCSPWDNLTQVTLVLQPFQILFVPQALKQLQKVTKLTIICKHMLYCPASKSAVCEQTCIALLSCAAPGLLAASAMLAASATDINQLFCI